MYWFYAKLALTKSNACCCDSRGISLTSCIIEILWCAWKMFYQRYDSMIFLCAIKHAAHTHTYIRYGPKLSSILCLNEVFAFATCTWDYRASSIRTIRLFSALIHWTQLNSVNTFLAGLCCALFSSSMQKRIWCSFVDAHIYKIVMIMFLFQFYRFIHEIMFFFLCFSITIFFCTL